MNDMPSDWSLRRYSLALVALLCLAVLMRGAGIGHWSFASDELGTFNEVHAFQHGPINPDDPDANVPKMIPVAMALLHVGHVLFGTDEAGCRTVTALCSLLQIASVGFGFASLLGRRNTWWACLLLTTAPEHLFYAHYHRFYAPAALFVTWSAIAMWHAVRGTSVVWLFVACGASWLAMLTQTLTASITGALVLAAFTAAATIRKRFILITGVNVLLVGLFAVFYLYPLGKGKAIGYAWVGNTIPQAIYGGIEQLSLLVAVFVAPGWFMVWHDRSKAWFLAAYGACWMGTMLLFPKLIPFHSAYLFPLNVFCFMCAGIALGHVVRGFAWPMGLLMGGAMLGLNVPGVLSYYQDGNRHLFREAATHMVQVLGPEDVIAFVQGDKFEYYEPSLHDRWRRLPPRDFEQHAEERKPMKGRLWIVIPGGRNGVQEPWRMWVQQRCRLRYIVRSRRYDYHDYPILFFTLEPPDDGRPPP